MLLSLLLFTSFLSTSLCTPCPTCETSASVNTETECPSRTTYFVKSGDTAAKISQAQHVSTKAILNINGLNANGTDLLANSTICLPFPCNTYRVQSGEGCYQIAQAKGIPLVSFKQWNLDIDGKCTNLISGYDVCVGQPIGMPYTDTPAGGRRGGEEEEDDDDSGDEEEDDD